MNCAKLQKLYFVLILSLSISCQLQNKISSNNDIETTLEQKVISKPDNTNNGFLKVEDSLIKNVVIHDFKTVVTKKARLTKTISDKSIVMELIHILKKLPIEGDIYKKVAPSSSFCLVQFYADEELAGTANIYNNSLQMSNTAFLAKENKDEKLFLRRVKELLKK